MTKITGCLDSKRLRVHSSLDFNAGAATAGRPYSCASLNTTFEAANPHSPIEDARCERVRKIMFEWLVFLLLILAYYLLMKVCTAALRSADLNVRQL